MSDLLEFSSGALERDLREWSADEPSDDFARRVATQFASERGRSSRGSRRIVVPLFLVAALVTVGAAAAWDTWTRPVLVSDSRLENYQERAPELVSVGVFEQIDVAERDEERATSVSERSERPQLGIPVPEDNEPAAVFPLPPPRIQVPRCECGTSGIVCSCAE